MKVETLSSLRAPTAVAYRNGSVNSVRMSTCHTALTQRERPLALIEPFYPKGGNSEGGRRPVPLERMLRIDLLQLWLNLSAPAVEETLYDSQMHQFAGIDLGREPAPDETTACSFIRTPGLAVV